MKRLAASLIATAGFAVCLAPANAADLFNITATVGGQPSVSRGYSKFADAFDALSDQGLQSIAGNYSGTQTVSLQFDYRGLLLNYAYPVQGGSRLTLNIPDLGISQTFDGGSRNASQQLARDYLKQGDFVGAISKALARTSPNDPVAGNANSLMARQAGNDFAIGFLGPASRIASNGSGQRSLAGIGLRFGNYSQGNVDTRTASLPLSYSFVLGTSGHDLTVSVPINYSDTHGARAYSGAFALSDRFGLTRDWSLALGGSYGLTYAGDLGSVGQIGSVSATSTYVWRLGDFDLAMGNMLGVYQTLKFQAKGYSYDPGLRNTVFRNGLLLSQPVSMPVLGSLFVEYSVIDTRYAGSELYSRGYDEVGITIGRNAAGSRDGSQLRAGVSYLNSRGAKGVSFNVGYWF